MFLMPQAMENIIVGVKWQNCFSWYVTRKEIWVMDSIKSHEATIKKIGEYGMSLSKMWEGESELERQGIPVISEETIASFGLRIKKYRVTVDELRNNLKSSIASKSIEEVFYTFLPSLYLDFDNKRLYSMYTEPASFEDYVPFNWDGKYGDFLDLLQPRDRFWYDGDIVIIDFRKGVGRNERQRNPNVH